MTKILMLHKNHAIIALKKLAFVRIGSSFDYHQFVAFKNQVSYKKLNHTGATKQKKYPIAANLTSDKINLKKYFKKIFFVQKPQLLCDHTKKATKTKKRGINHK